LKVDLDTERHVDAADRFRVMILPALAAVALGLAACGSGTNTTAARASRTNGRALLSSPRPLRIYRTTLSGAASRPLGSPSGTGVAIIALHRGEVVCWRFSHLHGFTDATAATLHVGAKGSSGKAVVPLSTGRRLHHQGCVRTTAGLSNAIKLNPSGYYVSIYSQQYPAGAVRAQL
jgi:CHRD domain